MASTIVDGNRLTLLVDGPCRLDALIDVIDRAVHDVSLLYYIFVADTAGTRVGDAMAAAVARGVTVRLIVDGFGSDTDGDGAFIDGLRARGVDVCAFVPRFGRRFLMRNHQKFAVADRSRAVIGGFNVADAYFDETADGWRDLGLLIEGGQASQLHFYFDALFAWTRRPRAPMRTLRRALRRWSCPRGPMRWLHGGPLRRVSPWLRMLRADLRRATDVSLVAGYFAPTPDLTRLIDRAARRGRARVLTAGRTDNPASIGAARFTFTGLLRRGVGIFEYQRARLHTKVYVIDDVVHIGSANLDPRSLFLNVELMLRIEDATFAQLVRAYVDGELVGARERHLGEFEGLASVPDRLRNAFCYFLVAVLDPSVSRRITIRVD